MPTHARTRVEGHEAVRLCLRRFDHLPHINAHLARQEVELVHQGDVHEAEDVLEEFSHLRYSRRRDGVHAPEVGLVERSRPFRGLQIDATHNLRDIGELVLFIARVDALGREREIEIFPGVKAAFLQ